MTSVLPIPYDVSEPSHIAESGMADSEESSLVPKLPLMSWLISQPILQLRRHSRIVTLALSALCVVMLVGGSGRAPAQGSAPPISASSFKDVAARAQAAMDANQTSEAIRLYAQATAMQPSWSEGWWYLGTLYFDSNQIVKAHDAFLHFVSVEHRQAGPGYGMLGLTEFQLKDYPRALEALERGRILGLGDNEAFVRRVLYVDGVVNNLLGNPEIALLRLTRVANETAAEHPEAPEQSVAEDGELLDALGLAALRMQMLPQDIPTHDAALVRQAGHAQALISLQDRVKAGPELQRLAAENPSAQGVHYMYGVYLLKENPPQALDEFRRETEISPKATAAYIQMALQYLESAEYDKGLTYGRKAITLMPGNFAAHVACGRLLLGLGRSKEAVSELRTAVRLAPGSPDAHFALSRALAQAGLNQEAAQQRKEFERLKALANAADRQQEQGK